MLIKIAAAALLAAVLWWLLRLALALRWSKLSREAARKAEEAAGRRVVAELPLPSGEIELLLEDGGEFQWGSARAEKASIRGARLLLNGGVMAECSHATLTLPPPEATEAFDGRERWEVALYLTGGAVTVIPCGTLREGVSRETANRVFEAVRACLLARAARAPGAEGSRS